ncbi:MAG TPA: hypothetical protein IGS37_13060 [Synechococcales cyanobacterium M55_K2018_004]|nr:hypothetical protein [Synechococcales cyanobacterium M55_K2018_004]
MEIAVLIASLILLAVSSFYALLTFRMLREVRQENLTYRAIIEKQLKLANQPHLYCDVQPTPQGTTMKLEVYNVGSVPAYDLHICTIGAYTEEGNDIPTFMRTYIQPRFRKLPLQPDKVGYFGIRSSIRYPMLPVQKRLEVAINLPTRPIDIYAMVQFREISGGNYAQVYCFSAIDETGGYRANLVEPPRPELLERLHFTDLEDAKLPEKVIPFPIRDFIELWNHSLSYKLTVFYTEDLPQPQEVQDV